MCCLEHVPSQVELNVTTEFTISLPHGGNSEDEVVVSVTLTSFVDGSTLECPVSQLGHNEYSVVVKPLRRGRHELRVRSRAGEVPGSPCAMFVHCPPQLLGKPVRVVEGLGHPAGIAFRGNSEFIVTEVEPAGVSLWSKDGRKLSEFEGTTSLDNPYGVAVDAEGCIYIADLINCTVHKISADGKYLKAIGGSDQLAFPAGIKINPEGLIYICDDGNQNICVYNRELEPLFNFGEVGNDPGKFMSPSDLAFDCDGTVFIADTKRERIMAFLPDGRFKMEFGIKGQSTELEMGVCISRGFVYISDFWNNRIVVFSTAGEFVTSIGQEGSNPGEFDQPAGIAIDDDGFVYVCDQRNNRVQVF